MAKSTRGLLIVVDGTDGSGKSTQFELLKTRLQKNGHKVYCVKYPRSDSETGRIIQRYLFGEFGPKDALPPEYVSLLYSADRYAQLAELNLMLNQGFIVLADRYCQSNFAFQSAKFTDSQSQRAFLQWQQAVDARMPRPDAFVFFDMPPLAAQQLLQGQSRPKDLHEQDVEYQSRVRSIYQQLAKKEKWIHVVCAKPVGENWNVFSREAVHENVYSALAKQFKWKL